MSDVERQYIFVVFDVCTCLSYYTDRINFKQLQFAKGAKYTHFSFKIQIFALQAAWFYKGNIIMHNIIISTGPNVETLWTPKAQT